jgi:hypothetical protein
MNVESLPHYWERVGPHSPHKDRYAPPPAYGAAFWPPVALGVVGVLAVAGGTVLAGLLALVAAAVWGATLSGRVKAAQDARTLWRRKKVCLACEKVWA